MEAEVTGAGPAVVLLHGQPGTGADWAVVAPRLAAAFEVIVADRPGWGRTAGPAGGFATNAVAVIDLLDRLDRPRAVLVGHSWAGGVALAVAQAWPERTAGLVLLASVTPGQAAGRIDRLLGAPGIGDLAVPVAFGLFGRLFGSRPARRILDRSAPSGPRAALAALMDGRAEDAGAGGTKRGSHRRVGGAFTVEQRAYLDELDALADGLDAITTPTEVVTGDGDRVVSPQAARRLASTIPTAVFREVPRAGHLLPLEHPEVVEAAVHAVARRAGLLPP
jgi:pimeloyl-ACP methyl ester carboxylesterase